MAWLFSLKQGRPSLWSSGQCPCLSTTSHVFESQTCPLSTVGSEVRQSALLTLLKPTVTVSIITE